jgi:nitrite reductase (NADH) small subunit
MTVMDGYTKVGVAGDFREGRGRVVVVEGLKVAVFRIGERLHAVKDACPHMGASLGDGKLQGLRVTCHMHGWTFDLETGMCSQTRQNSAVIYEVATRGDDVFVKPPPAPQTSKEDDDWIVFDPGKHLKNK